MLKEIENQDNQQFPVHIFKSQAAFPLALNEADPTDFLIQPAGTKGYGSRYIVPGYASPIFPITHPPAWGSS